MSKVGSLVAFLFVLPACVIAQDQPKCNKGYQPYGGRCVSQRMSDYIACVEASGGNHEELTEEVNDVASKQLSAGARGSGSGVIAKGSGSLNLNSGSEKELAKRIQQKWYSDAMKQCAKVLDAPSKKSSQNGTQHGSVNAGQGANVQIGNGNTNTTYIYKRQQDEWLVLAQQGIELGQKLTTLGATFYQQWKDATPKCKANDMYACNLVYMHFKNKFEHSRSDIAEIHQKLIAQLGPAMKDEEAENNITTITSDQWNQKQYPSFSYATDTGKYFTALGEELKRRALNPKWAMDDATDSKLAEGFHARGAPACVISATTDNDSQRLAAQLCKSAQASCFGPGMGTNQISGLDLMAADDSVRGLRCYTPTENSKYLSQVSDSLKDVGLACEYRQAPFRIGGVELCSGEARVVLVVGTMPRKE